jgi:hypothetical protein
MGRNAFRMRRIEYSDGLEAGIGVVGRNVQGGREDVKGCEGM